jgi:hypothetical protein
MRLLADRTPTWIPVVVIAAALLFAGFTLWDWRERRATASRARDQAMPTCVADLGSEDVCRARFDQFHEDCARLNKARSGRSSPASARIDPYGYLRCVELGVDAWVAENGRQQDAAGRQRAHDLQP